MYVYSDDEIWRALSLAKLKDFFAENSLGLDHELSTGSLSAG